MSSPPPTKPPRGVKQGKETSGLLMSVIRTLSASETNEQREKERAKLEKEYKKSDARLDELVAAHAQEIMDVMQKFSAVGAALRAWGQRGEAATARLAACRGLLRLRRNDLRRLWADARTHHYALDMLTDIERVVVSERAAGGAAAAGRWLAAACTLRAALAAARTRLAHVHALHATRHHLETKKLELVEAVLRRISEAVYGGGHALVRRPTARRRAALLLAELTKSEEVTDEYLQDITPDFEASLSEEDKTFETTVMISLEALGVLDQLKEATEKFKVQIQNELLEVIDSVSRRIIEEGDVEVDIECEEDGEMPDADGVTETGRPLARLISSLSEEFRACAARNRRLLQLWRAALQKHRLSDVSLHTEQHYWSAVQQVLQLLLAEYLDIESVAPARAGAGPALGAGPGGAAPAAKDLRLADYFARKRPQRRRHKLFKLEAASEVSVRVVSRRRAPVVCRADPALLHAALPPLHALCAHIEPLTGGGECSLRAFLADYVRTGECARLAAAARARIDAAMRAPAAWRERGAPPASPHPQATHRYAMSEHNMYPHPNHYPHPHATHRWKYRVVFTCCAEGWRAVERAGAAARRCGACGGGAALRACAAALAALAAHCRAAPRAPPAPPAPPASRAARWLADDDIVRFLQSLPNWRALLDHEAARHDAQELKDAYEREADTLVSTLGDGAVTRREIVADITQLADIALLCASMDWLCANVKTIPSLVSAPLPGGGGTIKLTDKFLNEINSAAMIFEEISHKCLLFLHLEMRIACVHYLGQEEREEGGAGGGGAGGAADDSAQGGGAARLAHALLSFHEQAASVLAPHMLAYIMDGVGEMMSAAVVWRWQGESGGRRGGAGAGARLALLRHCLAALQLPHAGLHRAHAYLHLLACTPQEIITSIREKGAQFSELQYLNALKVIGARRGLSAADMRAHQDRLAAALGHVGVTV
ncbi:LOW QUALITY PROTEIN: exocyst complex component secretory 8 [Aphomia sociella]